MNDSTECVGCRSADEIIKILREKVDKQTKIIGKYKQKVPTLLKELRELQEMMIDTEELLKGTCDMGMGEGQ